MSAIWALALLRHLASRILNQLEIIIYQKCTSNIVHLSKMYKKYSSRFPHPWISLSLYSLEACWEFITARHENKKILRWRKMAKRSCCSFSIWTWTPIPLVSLKCDKCTKKSRRKKTMRAKNFDKSNKKKNKRHIIRLDWLEKTGGANLELVKW